MTPSKITPQLFVGIAVTIGFNLSPIMFGYGMPMNICFLVYAVILITLYNKDRRVLGYAAVLSACNPANTQANISFSLLLALATIFVNSLTRGQVIRELCKHRWWRLFLLAFFLIVLSVPFWPGDLRNSITQLKDALSRLGYLVVLPLAVGLTIRTPRDGVRAVSLLCLMSVAFFVGFYFIGQSGTEEISAIVGGETIGVQQHIGNISINFNRTQVCIPLAVLSVVALAIGLGEGLNRQALIPYLASGTCVFMIMLLASTGSASAMVCGMGVMALGYLRIPKSQGRILLSVILFFVVGSALYWGAFRTESMLSSRIALKTVELNTTGIDRMIFWEEGIAEISKTPFGEGWSTRTGHSDWLLFLLSYGWSTGLAYIMAIGTLFLSMWRALRAADHHSSTLLLIGLAALSVYIVNAILDMPSANIGYYQIVWALILTPAAVIAVTYEHRLEWF